MITMKKKKDNYNYGNITAYIPCWRHLLPACLLYWWNRLGPQQEGCLKGICRPCKIWLSLAWKEGAEIYRTETVSNFLKVKCAQMGNKRDTSIDFQDSPIKHNNFAYSREEITFLPWRTEQIADAKLNSITVFSVHHMWAAHLQAHQRPR